MLFYRKQAGVTLTGDAPIPEKIDGYIMDSKKFNDLSVTRNARVENEYVDLPQIVEENHYESIDDFYFHVSSYSNLNDTSNLTVDIVNSTYAVDSSYVSNPVCDASSDGHLSSAGDAYH